MYLNSSSGIQILPAILPDVSKCTTFIREPTWVAAAAFAGFEPRKFTDAERAEFNDDPKRLTEFRRWLEHNANKIFPLFVNNSTAQSVARDGFEATMRQRLQDEDLESKLIPEWAVGCRR